MANTLTLKKHTQQAADYEASIKQPANNQPTQQKPQVVQPQPKKGLQLQEPETRERLSKKCAELPDPTGGAEIAKILCVPAYQENCILALFIITRYGKRSVYE